MVPRIDMTFLDVNASYQEIMDIFRQEKYTRYPVYEETTDNVIGIVNIKGPVPDPERQGNLSCGITCVSRITPTSLKDDGAYGGTP